MQQRIQHLFGRHYRLALAAAVAGFGVYIFQKPAKKVHLAPYDFEAQSITPQDLCHRVFTEGEYGYPVRLTFRLPISPTPNPLVWEYRPGVPSANFAPILQIKFRTAPPANMPKYPTVLGTVTGVRPDKLKRPKGHLGVVVIADAHLPLAASP